MTINTNSVYIDTCTKILCLRIEQDSIFGQFLIWGKCETLTKRLEAIELEIKLLIEKVNESAS